MEPVIAHVMITLSARSIENHPFFQAKHRQAT
jgi:hypothetical protein